MLLRNRFTKNIRKALIIALVAILIAAGVFTNPVTAQSGRALFNWVIADKALVQDGGLTVIGTTLTASSVTVGTNLILAAPATATVTNGMTLTPGGSYQPLSAAGAVGFGAITVGTAGNVLTLVNTVNQTITITDAGTLKLTGNVALGQYDSVTLISDGAAWIEISASNN